MKSDIQVGDRVKLLSLPDWLVADLPEGEKTEMQAFIGQSCLITEIDQYGYFWLGFGSTETKEEDASYSGHSFCVPREFIEISPEN